MPLDWCVVLLLTSACLDVWLLVLALFCSVAMTVPMGPV